MSKTCNKCRKQLPNDMFTKRKLPPKKDGTAGVSLKNNCKDCASTIRTCHRYGLTEVELASMIEAQNNLCKICKKPETTVDTRYGRTRTLSVDHCHTTGKIRGLLCENCNRALGLLGDEIEIFNKAAEYLSLYK